MSRFELNSKDELARPASGRLIIGSFTVLSFFGLLGRLGSGTITDECVYSGISRSLWTEGRGKTNDGEPGGELFTDNPIIVSALLAPVASLPNYMQSIRIA